MTNTDSLYTALRDFTNTRSANRTEFLKKKNALERHKGSAYYSDELKAARKAREDADAVAREICKKAVNEALQAMQKANSKRGLTAPTVEQVHILEVLRMLKKPSKSTLDAAANSMSGNALALAALSEIAHEAYANEPAALDRLTPNYSSRATTELGVESTLQAIKELAKTCGEIMNSSGANRKAVMGKEFTARVHGLDYDPDSLPQEELYKTERDFYNRELNVDYDLFKAAVNEST